MRLHKGEQMTIKIWTYNKTIQKQMWIYVNHKTAFYIQQSIMSGQDI